MLEWQDIKDGFLAAFIVVGLLGLVGIPLALLF